MSAASVKRRLRRRHSRLRRLAERDGPGCRYCGSPFEPGGLVTVDHLVPRSRGGGDDLENLVLACWDCNKRKGGLLPGELHLAGMRLRDPWPAPAAA